MDQSYSESDVSLSPSQILERLQVLRQLQLLQRGKLQKHRLQYQESSETSSSITEIVSQFSNSTSYNSFRSLLQNSRETNEVTPPPNTSNITSKVKEQDLVDGVSVLNLSQESEFVVNSPVSSKSQVSVSSRNATGDRNSSLTRNVASKALSQKHIALDEMPILSPKQDFEALVLEKLKNEKMGKNKSPQKDNLLQGGNKKPFLKRGEGMARYGLRRNDLVIQNTQALPWKRKTFTNSIESPLQKNLPKKIKSQENVGLEIFMTDSKASSSKNSLPIDSVPVKISDTKERWKTIEQQGEDSGDMIVDSRNCEIHCSNKPISKIQPQKGKQSLHATSNKGKTWAAVLTKEQNDFLRQLKQSEYYKNFASPAKSTVSDMSCDENLNKLRQEREIAEQNVFELLETKVTNESFSIENSFINKFLKRNKLECSGESTPLIMQKCLTNNPELMHIFPDIIHKRRNDQSFSEVETCNSEYTDCCSDNCSVSSCCSCKTVETVENSRNRVRGKETKKRDPSPQRDQAKKKTKENNITDIECKDDTVTENDIMKANMAEMNAKLFATGEHLKDKLNELEDEIQTFKKENTNLAKLREEIDLERQKFYEEKSSFEQKLNEEKILSEYYLAEEKEKLSKQKQTYERYVREMRGRLNKKEKDEVVNLKKEISDLKEEIRLKDAKTTSTIARLRNQIKNMEKERKDLQDEVEKLKKENRRIQHSNDITRRLSNIKYLEEINKKLTHMSSKDVRSEVNLDNDAKYKSYEIERQSRSKRVQSIPKGTIRPRAKSVPNLKVTSRYAKYFSQRDAVSQMDTELLNAEPLNMYPSDNEDTNDNDNVLNDAESIQDNNSSDSEPENHLEKVYMQRFQSGSTVTNRSSSNNPNPEIWHSINENPDRFFIRKSNSGSNRDSNSSNNTISPLLRSSSISNTSRSKSPLSVLSNRSVGRTSPANTVQDARDANSQRSKSPISILSNRSSGNRLATVVNQDQYRDKLMTLSPEPSTSKTSLTKTSLNPTEIKKPDGSKELRFPNGNIKYLSSDGKYSKFVYYNGDVKENFFDEGRIKYFYAEANTYHTTHADGLEVLEFPDGQVEKRYKDGSSEIRLPNGSIRYFDPKNEHVREEWRFPDGTALTVSSDGEQRIVFSNGQIEIHAKDHKRREFPDGTVKLVYNDGTAETRYASGRVRIKDKHGNLIMDSAPG